MIAVISDSHIPGRADKIPEQIEKKMEEADLIVHAGDFTKKKTYEKINKITELIAVKGNCDEFELPASKKFTKNQTSFGVYHGTGINPRGDHETLKKIASKDLEVDILVTGHTHHEEITELENCLIINPGTCTGVGGGSAQKKPPTMIELQPQKQEKTFKAKILEQGNGKLHTKKEKTIETIGK